MTNKDLTLSLDDLLGGSGERLMRRRDPQGGSFIPALFTYRGYRELFLKESTQATQESSKDNWVVDDGTHTDTTSVDVEQLNKQVTRLYLADYQRTWESLLGNLSITPFHDINNALDQLDEMAGAKSPLRSLLQAVADNTDLTRPPKSALSAVAKAAANLTKNVEKPAAGDTGNPAQAIHAHFAPQSICSSTASTC